MKWRFIKRRWKYLPRSYWLRMMLCLLEAVARRFAPQPVGKTRVDTRPQKETPSILENGFRSYSRMSPRAAYVGLGILAAATAFGTVYGLDIGLEMPLDGCHGICDSVGGQCTERVFSNTDRTMF